MNYKGNKIKIKCLICDKVVSITPYQFKKYKNHFCSRNCLNIWKKEAYKNNHFKKRKNKTLYYCKYNCGKIVFKEGNGCSSCSAKRRIRNLVKKFFCVDCNKPISIGGTTGRCQSCWTKERFKDPKNNPSYIDGRTPLCKKIRRLEESINWKKEVFERDNYRCQECFKLGGNLHSHHLKEFNVILKEFLNTYSQFSPVEDKETLLRLAITYEPFWDINNGKTLCKECHKKTDNYLTRKV